MIKYKLLIYLPSSCKKLILRLKNAFLQFQLKLVLIILALGKQGLNPFS